MNEIPSMRNRRRSGHRAPSLGVPLSTFLGALFLASVASSPPSGAQEVDSFYQRLYGDALRSSSLGRHQEAAKELRLACFGMLEHPERLGDCLVRLALEEAELGRTEEFVATASRLAEVEERFQGYSRSDLPEALRNRFEEHMEELVPEGVYARIPAFKSIAERRRASRLSTLPAEERSRELDRIIAQDPRNPRWRVLRGNLALEQGRPTEAAEIADRLVADFPPGDDIFCLRGRAQVAVGACAPENLQDLERCAARDRSGALEAVLGCHVRAGRWQQADETLALMDDEQRKRRDVRSLEKEIRRGKRSEKAVEVEAAEAASRPGDGSTDPGTAPGPADRETLAAGWEVLHSDAREDFEPTYAAVKTLADRHLSWSEAQHLTAELAYRLSLWDQAVLYFTRAEEIVSEKPNLQFYLAVALYKSGDREAASEMLDRCLPHIQSSDFVDFWVARIRSAEG